MTFHRRRERGNAPGGNRNGHFNAIADTIGGGEYGAERALDMLFNYQRKEPNA